MSDGAPDFALPRVWCDFNACGWTGEPGDDCYYVLDVEAIAARGLTSGTRVFIWDDDGNGEIIGCVGKLEVFRDGWRVRPAVGTWFQGRA